MRTVSGTQLWETIFIHDAVTKAGEEETPMETSHWGDTDWRNKLQQTEPLEKLLLQVTQRHTAPPSYPPHFTHTVKYREEKWKPLLWGQLCLCVAAQCHIYLRGCDLTCTVGLIYMSGFGKTLHVISFEAGMSKTLQYSTVGFLDRSGFKSWNLNLIKCCVSSCRAHPGSNQRISLPLDKQKLMVEWTLKKRWRMIIYLLFF